MVAATFHPFSEKYFAAALPMPELVPVISTVLVDAFMAAK
jgi:hypothetical protein